MTTAAPETEAAGKIFTHRESSLSLSRSSLDRDWGFDVICVTCIVQTQTAFSNGYYIEATQNSNLTEPKHLLI